MSVDAPSANMASRKRARAADSPSSSAAAATKITLSGGEAHHSSLVAFWRKEKFTDIAVCAEGVEFKAHRAALASSSGYFLSLFDSGMRDAASPTHALEGLRSPVLEALLAFVYEGSCEVEAGLLTEMLDAAARLVIDPLKAACARAIQAQLDPCNALDVWRLADLYTLPALEKAAVASALGGFEELPPQSASGAQVLTLVQEDRLEAKSEEAVFQWVVRWQEAAKPTEAELLAVMKHVRFAAMDAGFVQTTVQAWPALVSIAGRDVILGSYQDTGRALQRWGIGPRMVYILGGINGEYEVVNTVDVYDPRTDAWKQVSSMPTNRFHHGVAALAGKIYVMGGSGKDHGHLSTASVYDPQSDQWQPLADIASARSRFAAVAADGKIYAIGGVRNRDENDDEADDEDTEMTMAAVEAFDPVLGAWAKVASMSVQRSLHAVAVVDGKIYAIGGYGTDDLVDSVEMYNPQADNWQQMASMPQAMCRHAAAAMGGKIFVTGGFTHGSPLSTVMEFDPEANTWTTLANMGMARAGHTSASIGGKLYVFGGKRHNRTTASEEAYDPISNTWAQISPLGDVRDDSVAVSL